MPLLFKWLEYRSPGGISLLAPDYDQELGLNYDQELESESPEVDSEGVEIMVW